MDRDNAVAREVEAALRAFEPEPRLDAGPDFYAGVRRRIRAEEGERVATRLPFRRRVLVPALLVLMVVLNIVTAMALTKARKSELAAREQGLSALVENYAAGQASFASYLK